MIRSLKYYFLTVAICFCHIISIAQQTRVDSLLTVLKTEKKDTSKVNILNDLFLQYEFTDDQKAQETLDNALSTSQKNGYKKGLINTYIYFGCFAEDKSSYSEALKYYSLALSISKDIENKDKEADSYCSLGNVFDFLGNYPEALKNYLSALKLFEATDNKRGIAESYNNIGIVYYNLKNYTESLKNISRSLKMMIVIGNKKTISDCYGNIGSIYEAQGNHTAALINDSLSLKMEELINDKPGIAETYNNIGRIYYEKGNYQEALIKYFASVEINKEIGNKTGIATSNNSIGEVFTKQNKYKEAEEYFLNAKKIAKEIGSKECIREAYIGLTELNAAKGDYKGAFENHKLYILYRDSLDNEGTQKKTIQSQMTYDFEKKEAIADAEHKKELENQQLLAEEKSHKQKTVLLFVVIGLLLVIVFSGFIFRSLRITSKQKKIIEIKNKETELQKNIIEEKHKEITDSINYAERIQRSFLASESLLDENLKDHFVFFQPKDIVSGDFYWAARIVNSSRVEKFVLATADSTGHGVPGAIMSILNISSLEKAIEQNISEPAEILNHTRTTIINRLKRDGSAEGGKDGMDCSLICFDFNNLKMTYAAANNPVWIVRKDQLMEFKPDNMPVGKHDNDQQSFTQHEIQLQKNDVVYTLTDGLPDQFGGPKGKKFMYKQLKEILIEINHLSMNEQKKIVQNRFAEWKGNNEQVDDILLIGVRL